MRLINIEKSYGNKQVFKDFNLTIDDGGILCILGASGCGKSTLLNIIAGLTPFNGTIERDFETDASDRRVSFVFQNPRLLKNLTVFKNLELVLKGCIKDKAKRSQQIEEFLERVDLLEVRNAFPSQLSGGMKQRLTLARAFLYPSKLLLMDEPFKELDISLKKQIIEFFKTLYLADKRTTVMVTHDLDEAVLLATKIIVLSKDGRIVLERSIDRDIVTRDTLELATLRSEIYSIL